MKEMLGSLFMAGFGPDCLERYSWDQIALMGECIARHHAGMLDAILTPVAALMGAKFAKGKVKRGKSKPVTSIDYTDFDSVKRAKDRDARILIGAGAIPGIQIDL